MHRRQRLDQAPREPPYRILRQRAAHLDGLSQRRAGHERSGQPRHFLTSVHNGGGVQAVDLAGGGDLAPEPADEPLITGELRADHFHGDCPASRREP
jgi:hypothetical protein